jgi:hypothetical protein
MNLAAFKDPAYTVYCLSAFTVFLGIYTGLSPSFVSLFLDLLYQILNDLLCSNHIKF